MCLQEYGTGGPEGEYEACHGLVLFPSELRPCGGHHGRSILPAVSLLETFYSGAVRAFRGISPTLARGESKLARGIRGRRGASEHLSLWAQEARDPSRTLVWFHAPSVGEGLQARIVMDALKEEVPSLQLAYTYFSPSAVAWAGRTCADVTGYLPWDLPGIMGSVLDALRPDMVVFTKTEVWPNLSRAAERRGVPTAMIAASVPASAGRLRWPARALLRDSFRRLRWAGAIAEPDAERLGLMGVLAERVMVTGDPGIDSAARRAGRSDPDAGYLRPFHSDPCPTLVAGSTWEPDEEVLIPACSALRESVRDLRVILAPHEPTERRLGQLRAGFLEMGWSPATLSDVEAQGAVGGADVILVDRVGVLAHLYTVATVAYVGGGFHRHGLHSVLEPAAARIPVAFGPRRSTSPAAESLLERSGASEVSSPPELTRVLVEWLTDEESRAGAAEAAFGYIEEHAGAARRTVLSLTEFLGHSFS